MKRLIATTLLGVALSGCGGDSKDKASPDNETGQQVVPESQIQEPENYAEPPVFGAAIGSPSEYGSWGDVIEWPLVAVSAANLPDGRILTYAGAERRTWPTPERTYSAVWDPDTGDFLEELHQGHNMFCAGMSMTAEGQVFVNGGRNAGASKWTSIFDFRENNWEQIENMASGGRWYPSTMALGDGRILTARGDASNPRNPDIWDPDEGWKVLNGATFDQGGWWPLVTLTPDGNVFNYWSEAQNHMVNTAGNGSTTDANSEMTKSHPGGVQINYDIGKVLNSGGNDGSTVPSAKTDAFTVDLNGSAPVLTPTSDMNYRRIYHNMTVLPTGEVLVIGGNTGGSRWTDAGAIMVPEIWNPQTGNWRELANQAVARSYHSTTLLMKDGRVLAAGGGLAPGDPNASGTHQDAQIFSPPYLFNDDGSLASRPNVTATNTIVDAGNNLSVNATENIAYFSLLRMAATTHQVNTDARFYKPEFTSTGAGAYEIAIHPNPNVSLPGYWQLFAIDAAGVPSEAQIIKITALDTRTNNLATSGTATQSSTASSANNLAAGNAVDGDLSSSEDSGSLAQTNDESEPWLEIDMGRSVNIDTVRIWNGSDPQANLHVLVSQTPFGSASFLQASTQANVTHLPIEGLAGRQTDVAVNQLGRYIRIQLNDTGSLSLSEVQVFGETRANLTNAALGGTATQSSDFAGKTADLAIDGNTDGNYNANSVSATGYAANSWWEVDLGRVVDIDTVNVWNRTEAFQDRLEDFYVFVSEEPFASDSLQTTLGQSDVFSRQHSGEIASKTVMAVGRTGRYVRVQLSDSNYLTLAEIEVMATEITEPLITQQLSSQPTPIGNTLSFTANATGTGLEYSWNFGDGTPDTNYTSDPTGTHSYPQPGRYVVSMTARDVNGDESRQTFTQIVHPPLIATDSRSSTSVLVHSNDTVWNVNPDNSTVSVVNPISLSLTTEIVVGIDPVSLAEAPNGNVWVINNGTADIGVINQETLEVVNTIALPRSSHPYGVVFSGNSAFIALEGTGEVIKLSVAGAELAKQTVASSPRHLTVNSAGDKLYVSNFITPPVPGEDTATPVVTGAGGEVVVLAADLTIQDTILINYSDRSPSEHQGPGLPNYLGALVISPDGNNGWLPSKQDNILGGQDAIRDGVDGLRAGPLTFDQAVRAITSSIDLTNNTEMPIFRVDHDNASIASSAVFGPYGATLFVSLEGNRQISVIDVYTSSEIGRFDTGLAPQGIALSNDGKKLYVHNFTDRTLGIYDVSQVIENGADASELTDLASISVVTNEQLAANVLRGKQLFYDARDDRLAGLDYMACASCHENGGHDGRTWDFTRLGEGLRNTITLQGRSGMGHGMLHWSGNFDEIQDFENQIRSFALGTGLMNDQDFEATKELLGPPKAGLSIDLDALDAYLTSLDRVEDSPWRASTGALTPVAENGKAIFDTAGCATCHSDEQFTDSDLVPTLHDIGTIFQPGSGARADGVLSGIDTPTLLGVWNSAPYLHDGSALTLQDAITAHTGITLNASEVDELATYLTQLDATENGAPPISPPTLPPIEPPGENGTFSNPLGDSVILVDGLINDWDMLTPFADDSNDATGANTLDWRKAWLAHDDNNFYIAYLADEAIVPTWGYAIYIDVDGDANTGFRGFANEYPIGADYLIEGGSVLGYAGGGTDWSWNSAASANYQFSGNYAELSISRRELGNPGTLRLFFHADNGAVGGSVIDHYPDAVTDDSAAEADRYMTYTIAGSTGNATPYGNPQAVSVTMNNSLEITLTAADSDDTVLTFSIVDQPASGTLVETLPVVNYTPDNNFVGVDSFTYTASDGSSTSAPTIVTVSVTGVITSNTLTPTIDGNLEEWATIASLGADPIDANNLNDSIDIVAGQVAHDTDNYYIAWRNETDITLNWGYSLYIDTDGSMSTGFTGFGDDYPIGADYLIEGGQLVKYSGTGNNWSWATVVGQTEIATQDTTAELMISRDALDQSEQIGFFFVGNNAAVNGSTIDYFPDGVKTPSAVTRFFEYSVSQTSVNRKPIATGQSFTTPFNTPVSVVLGGNDPEGEALSNYQTTQPANGSLTGNLPDLEYRPADGFSGVDTFSFTVSDGVNQSDAAVVSISVLPQQNDGSRIVSNPVTNMVADGDLQDWAGTTPFLADPADINIGQDVEIDWLQAAMAHTTTDLYIFYQMQNTVESLTWGHNIMMDTDGSLASGLSFGSTIGADYMLEGNYLYKYTGTGSDWAWQFIQVIDSQISGNVVEMVIPRSAFTDGLTAIELFFRGQNSAVLPSTPTDFYPDAAGIAITSVEDRKFQYNF